MSNPEIYESRLANTCHALCYSLSYDDNKTGKPCLKRTLEAAAHCLDTHAVHVNKERHGLLIKNARGKYRFLTWRERIAR